MLITVKIGHYTAAAIMYKFRLQPVNLKRQVNDYTRALESSWYKTVYHYLLLFFCE